MALTGLDLTDPDRYLTGVPHEDFALLRARAPVYYHPDPQAGGFWALTRHADVVRVSRDPETFSSYARSCMLWEPDDEALARQRLMMLNLDPPDHTRLRGLVNRGFTPRMVGRLEERIEAISVDIVDRAVERGECDFVTAVAAELPLAVIAELMGVPHEDRRRIFTWSNRMIGSGDAEYGTSPADGTDAAAEILNYAAALGERKRRCPADDIVSKLAGPDEGGKELSELEFGMFFVLLAVAGNETTRNAISGGMLALVEHPDQWARLKADRTLLATAADEIVRWVSPITQFRRTALRDAEVAGQPIRQGEKVVMFYPSANRDESVFADPDAFDIARSPNPHVGFGGGGPHFCLGSHLARLEIQVMFRTLLHRVDRVELAAGETRRLRSNFINGIKEMPVRLVAAESPPAV
ncbi:MAG: cytochrome P450 [Streptosporangiaceae bacterium]